MGAKLHYPKGKHPGSPSKVSKFLLSASKVVNIHEQREGWLRSSHPLKSA